MGARRGIDALIPAAGIAVGVLMTAGPSIAGPITFNTALPVAEDTYAARLQLVRREREDDLPGGRAVVVDGVVAALAYGFTRDWTGIAISRYLEQSLDIETGSGTVSRRARGIGDTTLLARRTVIERNAPGSLLRVAPIAGVVAPTGESDDRDARGAAPRPLQPGTGSWGIVGGVIVTGQTLAWEFDTALTATAHGRDEGFEPGDEFRFDASYQHRLPWPGRGADAFAYAVIEANGIHREDAVIDGDRVANGGTEWRIGPGLQYVTRRWVIEAAVELPLTDALPDTALRDERLWHVGLRFNF